MENKKNLYILIVILLIVAVAGVMFLAPSFGGQGFMKKFSLKRDLNPQNINPVISTGSSSDNPIISVEGNFTTVNDVTFYTGECVPAGQGVRDKVVVFDSSSARSEYQNYTNFYEGLRKEIEWNGNSQSKCPYLIEYYDVGPSQSYKNAELVCKDFDISSTVTTCRKVNEADGIIISSNFYPEGATSPNFHVRLNISSRQDFSFSGSLNANAIKVYRVADDYGLQ